MISVGSLENVSRAGNSLQQILACFDWSSQLLFAAICTAIVWKLWNYYLSGSYPVKCPCDPCDQRTIGIVDGSGVLYDPSGLSRAELTRLAQRRDLAEHNIDTTCTGGRTSRDAMDGMAPHSASVWIILVIYLYIYIIYIIIYIYIVDVIRYDCDIWIVDHPATRHGIIAHHKTTSLSQVKTNMCSSRCAGEGVQSLLLGQRWLPCDTCHMLCDASSSPRIAAKDS